MVYNGSNPINVDDLGGKTPYFWKHPFGTGEPSCPLLSVFFCWVVGGMLLGWLWDFGVKSDDPSKNTPS